MAIGGQAPDTPPDGRVPPSRVQLSRAKGWRMPPNTVKVDRTTPFGNPHILIDYIPRLRAQAFAAEAFRRWLADPRADYEPTRRRVLLSKLDELRGRNLACWCHLCPEHAAGKPFGVECHACEPCHSDPLGELANRPLQSPTLERMS